MNQDRLTKEIDRLLEHIAGIRFDEYIFDENFNRRSEDWDGDEDLGVLMQIVLFFHSKLEERIELELLSYINPNFEKLDEAAQYIVIKRSQYLFNRMEFYNKATAAKESKLISNKLYSQVLYVNSIRVWFSHPKAYQEKLMQFKNKQNYHDVLTKLIEIYSEF